MNAPRRSEYQLRFTTRGCSHSGAILQSLLVVHRSILCRWQQAAWPGLVATGGHAWRQAVLVEHATCLHGGPLVAEQSE